MKEGSEVLYITATLKDLIRLFDEDTVLENLGLGDTWHPYSGYVDERMIFKSPPTVRTFLEHDYDWKGLIEFSCKIGLLKIEKVSDTNDRLVYEFRVSAPFKALLKLYHLLIEKDAYEPGVYSFD